MIYAPDTIIIKTRSEVKVTRTKFGIPTSKNIEDMHQSRCRL